MKVGYSRLEITAPLGTVINGLGKPRIADGILDGLYATAVAFSDGDRIAVAITLDILEMRRVDHDKIRNMISERYGVDGDAVFIHCTHSHYTPEISGVMFEKDWRYVDFFFGRVADSAGIAIADLKEAEAYVGRGEAKNVSFVRRFIMKDGTCKMNPSKDDSDVICRESEPDESVQFIKFVRNGGHDVVIVNFATHPCTLGSITKFSADYIHFVRLTLEQALSDEANGKGAKVAFFNGAEGDTGTIDIYNAKRGYTHIQHIGRVIAGAVLSAYTYAEPVMTGKISFEIKEILIPSVSDRASARSARVSCLALGEVAFMGLPGEAFGEIGRKIKTGSAFKMTIPTCNTNDWISYIPTREAIPRGGYGAEGSTAYYPDAADMIIEASMELSKKFTK